MPKGEASETILVVEDDDDVRTYTVEVLRELGYRVIEAHDGPLALRLLERQERVDLLFTDIVLPSGLSGVALARRRAAIGVTSGFCSLPDMRVTQSFITDDLIRAWS